MKPVPPLAHFGDAALYSEQGFGMTTRLTAALLALGLVLSGAAPHLGHLCDVEGPVMGPDCCCGDEGDRGGSSHDPAVDVPACCDGSTDITSHDAVSGSEHEPIELALAVPILAIADSGAVRFASMQKGQLRLRAPPDPPRLPVYLRHQSLLI